MYVVYVVYVTYATFTYDLADVWVMIGWCRYLKSLDLVGKQVV